MMLLIPILGAVSLLILYYLGGRYVELARALEAAQQLEGRPHGAKSESA